MNSAHLHTLLMISTHEKQLQNIAFMNKKY